jgi:BirA family transcriptional regulator, biotin operon repressor / biotin---[acetyl-CoA-carboxylase] ligase
MPARADDLAINLLQHDLPTSVIGRPVLRYERLGSTNDLARERARAGRDEGLVVLAEEQTAGRGRMRRGWAAPPGSSLLMSLLLRPSWMPPDDSFTLTMMAGVALCEAVEQAAPLMAALKWPNDLMLPVATPAGPALRKAAGILSEIELVGDRIAWVVIGMGVNVNWTPRGTVDGRDLALVATSVSAAAGRPIDRLGLLRALLVRLDTHYAALRAGDRDALFEAWRGRLATLGQPTQIHLPCGELHGVAEAVEPSGALRVRDERGVVHIVVAGDVGG